MIRRLLEFTLVGIWLGAWAGCSMALAEKAPPEKQNLSTIAECIMFGVGWPAIVAYDATHALLSAPGA